MPRTEAEAWAAFIAAYLHPPTPEPTPNSGGNDTE